MGGRPRAPAPTKTPRALELARTADTALSNPTSSSSRVARTIAAAHRAAKLKAWTTSPSGGHYTGGRLARVDEHSYDISQALVERVEHH